MKHPARFNQEILDALAIEVDKRSINSILDPFGGTGGIFRIPTKRKIHIEALEIEPEWAAVDSRITLGDATSIPWPDEYFDAIVTSPTYGNRMADKTKGRRNYVAFLGRMLSANNTGQLNWSGKQKERYQKLHILAWKECYRVSRRYLLLNFKDHWRRKKLEKVSDWHKQTLEEIGFVLEEIVKVESGGYTRGRNRELRESHEMIMIFRKVEENNVYCI